VLGVDHQDAPAKVCTILVNWNGWRDTAECLESCRRLSHPMAAIIVVDNGSTDDSVRQLRRLFPEVLLITSAVNLGFAGGNNVGIHSALNMGAEYVWLLNNDTVVEPDALSALVAVMERDSTVGIAGSRITYFDTPEAVWFAGGFFSRWGWTVHRDERDPASNHGGGVRDVDFVTGCSLFARASAVREIGPLDERYFLYWEDVDWSVRATHAGWRVVYAPASVVRHKVSASMPDTDSVIRWRYEGRNRLLFYRRNRLAMFPWVMATSILDAGYLAANGRCRSAAGLVRGIVDGVLCRTGDLNAVPCARSAAPPPLQPSAPTRTGAETSPGGGSR
jgi:GT2 family glycosyltransferase